MDFKSIIPGKSISLFVKNILVFEEQEKTQKTVLPFFADGYPGLMFQQTENGLLVNPHNKRMPSFFLYGQTIKPIELVMTGTYKLIIFQLYPFVLKSFFDVSPIDINDDCYDLQQVQSAIVIDTISKLNHSKQTADRIGIISSLLYFMFQEKRTLLDYKINQAIKIIIDNKGQTGVGHLCKQLHLNERTFERRFVAAVGISAKQFSRIIQFQQSLEQLTVKDYTKLSDIVYSNGFADQSHFIRVFKAFTGKSPKKFVPVTG